MSRQYTLALIALDEETATFGTGGVVRLVIPAEVWREDGRRTTVRLELDRVMPSFETEVEAVHDA